MKQVLCIEYNDKTDNFDQQAIEDIAKEYGCTKDELVSSVTINPSRAIDVLQDLWSTQASLLILTEAFNKLKDEKESLESEFRILKLSLKNSKDWKKIVLFANQYKDIGMSSFFLPEHIDNPWHIATSCYLSGPKRFDIETSISFNGIHPCGITFSWYLNLELKKELNTWSPVYQLDFKTIAEVLGKVQPETSKAMKVHLREIADKLDLITKNYKNCITQSYEDSIKLKELVGEIT